MGTRRQGGLGALIAVLCAASAAQLAADEKGEAVLRAAFKTLYAAKTYTANITTEAQFPDRAISRPGTLAAMKPNFLRVEFKGTSPMLFVSDGKAYHIQAGERHQKQPVEAAPTAFLGQWEGEIDAFFGGDKSLTGREITLTGTESVGGVECDLVKVAGSEHNAAVVYAIGKTDHLIRRATLTLPGPNGTSLTQTNTLTAIKLNVPKTRKDFVFAPPPAAAPLEKRK
jgi:outer membrane lipoprotein-sorting protein